MSFSGVECAEFRLEAAVHNGHLWGWQVGNRSPFGGLELRLPDIYAWAGTDTGVIIAANSRKSEPFRAFTNRPNLPGDPNRRSEIIDYGRTILYREAIFDGVPSVKAQDAAFGIGCSVLGSGLEVVALDSGHIAELHVVLTSQAPGHTALERFAVQYAA